MTYVPLHHKQIVRTLPDWSKALHHAHASQIVQSLRKEHLDADGLPYPWFSQADTLTQQAVLRAIARRDNSRTALQIALAPLKGITEYCSPLLQQQLKLDIPISQAQYVYQAIAIERPDEVPGCPPVHTGPGPVVAKGAPQYRSLLEAALHNFEGPNDATRLTRLQRSRHDIMPIAGLALSRFIAECRALDLGKRYQGHLDEVFAGTKASQIQTLAVDARRDEFRVHVRVAACKGLIDLDGSAALHAVAADLATAPRYKGRPLRCWQQMLFGIPIHEMLFIAPEPDGKHDPVFVYDPMAPDRISAYSSLGAAHRHLHKQLLQEDYRKRFVGLALQRQQAELHQKLSHALYKNAGQQDTQALLPRESIHLEAEEFNRPNRPWADLESAHLARLRADARSIAVPTADVDARVRQRNLEYWLDLGFTVLNVAAMFVPCLNPIMMTLGAAQIMNSVFEGISAWEAGDNAQALAQLESVLLNIGVVAAAGAGAGVLKASGFVDGMRSIVKDGKEYLWSARLDDYASPLSIPDSVEADHQGRYTVDGHHYVRIDSTLYQQEQEQGRWRLTHPQDPQAYRPPLLNNGEGTWRGVHEAPVEWDQPLLLRRLGPVADGLNEGELQAALKCSGEQDATLRFAQVAAQRPPALLADVLDRLRSNRQVDDLIQRVGDQAPLHAYRNFALPSLTELEGWPQRYVIKAYHGPENWGASTRYGTAPDGAFAVEVEINRGDLEGGALGSRVVAQLDDDSLTALLPANTTPAERGTALATQLARHLGRHRETLFERFYTQHQAPLAPPAQALANQFQGLPWRALEEIIAHTDASERLRLAAGRVPLRVAEEARVMQARARLDMALLGMYRPALATPDSAVLDTALAAEHPAADAEERFALAAANRSHAAELIGQQPVRPGYRSPMRLAHGRIGYPLSGWRSWFSPADRRLRALYPRLDTRQRSALLRQLRQRGDVGAQLGALERERDALDTALRQWESEGVDSQRDGRVEARERINAAWRRDDPDSLTLEALEVEALPSLPARFDHIITLNIRRIGVRRIPADFFQSFPRLRTLRLVQNPELDFDGLFRALALTPGLEVLELGANGLNAFTTDIRQGLGRLTRLRQLSLRGNALQLVAADLQVLGQLPIEALDLESNNIVLDETLASGFTHLATLRDLLMTNNPLQYPPDVTGLTRLANLQLRNCSLQAWPRGLTQLMLHADPQLRYLALSYNPISQVEAFDSIVTSPFAEALRTNREHGYWDFNENGLDDESNRRLRATGVEAGSDSEWSDSDDEPWLESANADQRQLWRNLFEAGDSGHLRVVVERTANSAQAQSNPQRMANQVWRLLEQAGQDQALRAHLDNVAQEYPPTCGDAGADGFSALELEAQTFTVMAEETDRPYYLFNYFRRLYRREMVNAMGERIQLARLARQAGLLELERLPAVAQPETLALPALDSLDELADPALLQGGVDLIEIRLALRQALSRQLEFPENSRGMLYRAEAMISVDVEENVLAAVRLLDDTASERRAWIARQPIWQRYLTQHFSERFARLDAQWYRGLEYLDYCLEPESEAVASLDDAVLQAMREALPGMQLGVNGQLRRVELSSQLYDQASRRLEAGRELQRQALFEELTNAQDYNNR
ncbi:MAG: NEL-type E3 ubiquitin ligase domain-containing protein [Candidatus Pseudomonas phytovorans]|uniref:RING-type E3 ubiquitin transferase n=1 Tax=Candidatus Pseudomonas phytovorans TaxID=3121377 RepID=A0AAJ5WEW3_9PSED|nr:NEL-type E3 ubiquitin ligase domain-containing protein [Pseudomonas sp.]WEK29071.1 MAG: NEL-type E3 ubiquitin ligase domain-containing protein [Pseudomonas sp.]